MAQKLQTPIKKMSFQYCECPIGDLHSGQLLNLVCVDSSCTKRGLICPVCRMNNHQEHQIMPLKIFLDEIKKLFLQSQDSQSLNNLSDYLRSLENSRKQLIGILKQAAEDIANDFKAIQKKIQDNYITIRRNVLAQSSISTKLPSFIDILSQNDPAKDAYTLQEEFQKYSELIKFQNNTMNISDKAKKLVEDYSKTPAVVQSTLKKQVELIKTSFHDALLGKSLQPPTVKKSETLLTFSEENKYSQVSLIKDNKGAQLGTEIQNMGIAYIKGKQGENNKKITFQIISSSSGQMSLGMGIPEKDKDVAFIFSSPIPNQHFLTNCTGAFPDQSFDSQADIDLFVFDQSGKTVTITYTADNNEIVFQKTDVPNKKVIKVEGLSEQEKKKLQFCVILAESDSVCIVEN